MTYKALIIAVDQYILNENLPNTLNDANEIKRLLLETPSYFNEDDVYVFQGSDANKDNLTSVLRSFFGSAGESDILFLFWAGHGDKIYNEGYFVPYDGDEQNPQKTMMKMTEIRDYIDQTSANTVLSFFDTCYSGAITRSFQRNILRGLEIKGTGKVLIAACTEKQKAGDRRGHGAFTDYLIKGLEGEASDSDGDIDVYNLYSYISKKLKEEYSNQNPIILSTLNGEPILLKRSVYSIKKNSYIQVIDKTSVTSIDRSLIESKIIEASNFYNKSFILEAINLYEEIKSLITIKELPFHYGFILGELGKLYVGYSRKEDPEKNLVKSLSAFESAIKIYEDLDDKNKLADNFTNLGVVYCNIAKIRNSEENYLKAIESYNKSIQILGEDEDVQGFLQTLCNIGNTYTSLAVFSNKKDNLENAIRYFKKVLDSINKDNELYGQVLVNLANVVSKKHEITRNINELKETINLLDNALVVYGIENDPLNNSLINNNLSNAYRKLSEVENPGENVNSAIKFALKALRIRTRDKLPFDYAHTQKVLGSNYIRLAQLSNKENDINNAIEALIESLSIFTITDFPLEYAHVNFHLGNAYHLMANIKEKQKNIDKAIFYTELSEEIYARKHNTIDLAKIELKLGQLYRELYFLSNKEITKLKALDYLKKALITFEIEGLINFIDEANYEILILSEKQIEKVNS